MNTNNKNIRRQNKIEDCIEWIDILSSEGDTVKMRTLKELSNVRDYSIIKVKGKYIENDKISENKNPSNKTE